VVRLWVSTQLRMGQTLPTTGSPSPGTDALSDLVVLRRGRVMIATNELKAGWSVQGVVVGQFRAYGK
jgi:hypothetical protein